MSDPIVAATNITGWANRLPNVPKGLSDAIEVFNNLRGMQAPDEFPDLSTVTVKTDVGAIVDTYAAALAKTDYWGQAYASIRSRLAAKVINAAKASTEEIVTTLQPAFDKTAERFIEAAQSVPGNCDSEYLVAAGPTALDAYYAAKEAQNDLEVFETFVRDVNVSCGFGFDLGYWLIVTPHNRVAAQYFIHAEEVGGGIRGDLLYAAKNTDQFTFELRHPHDIAITTQSINSEDVVSVNQNMVRF